MAVITTASIITSIRGIIKDLLQTDGQDVFEYDTATNFKLGEPYISVATIKVYKNEDLLTITTDYTYNATTNRVTIIASLTKKDNIIVTYSYYQKYSDSEIQNYIKASLIWFVRKNYSKYFYMNASDEVVTLDGIQPTEREADMVALVTAIDIDPKNINISTKDFKFNAVENKSRTEQIDEAFAHFTRTFGTVGFLEKSF